MSSILCLFCNFINKNNEEINKSRDIDTYILSKIPYSSLEDTNEQAIKCKSCLGIFSNEKISNLISLIQKESKGEYNEMRLSTGFSSLFSILHKYLLYKYNEELNLDVGLIRKAFKPILGKEIKSRSEDMFFIGNSNTELVIVFDFKEEAYEKTFSAFDFIEKSRRLLEKKQYGVKNIDRSHINDIINGCNKDIYMTIVEKYDLINVYMEGLSANIEIINNNIYLKGSYVKFSREIGQSPWEINGVKVCHSSVQDELKKELIILFSATDVVMHAGGREDRDVRMIGSGRPLVLEIVNPKCLKSIRSLNNEDFLNSIESLVNKSTRLVKLIGIEPCEKGWLSEIKMYEDTKIKNYRCVVYCKRQVKEEDLVLLNSIKDLEIIQKTPIRVSHRRTLMDRKKMILYLKAERINENFFILDVASSAGTYIKEFVHSDLGRTCPSVVSMLNADCDILQLDVTNIILGH